MMTQVQEKSPLVFAQRVRQQPAFLKAVRIPPAWTDLEIATDRSSKIWARGRDSKGRLQKIYNPAYRQARDVRKFAGVQRLERRFESVVLRNNQNLTARCEETRECAEVLRLILHTGIRPGTTRNTGGDVQAYGATTLLGQHVRRNGAELHFTGKKGVALVIPVSDPAIRRTLAARAKAAGRTGELFPSVDDAALRSYTRRMGAQVKPKDFRTLLACRIAKATVADLPVPTSPTARKKAMRAVAAIVAQKLGNTAAVCLKSYINPEVFNVWN